MESETETSLFRQVKIEAGLHKVVCPKFGKFALKPKEKKSAQKRVKGRFILDKSHRTLSTPTVNPMDINKTVYKQFKRLSWC